MEPLPYRIAVLCYLFDKQGRTLLIHRNKAPNLDLYSPIGGKLEQAIGESPTACAAREIREEAGLEVDPRHLHLTGIISERSYEGSGHWLMFLFELMRPVERTPERIAEGQLEWHDLERILSMPIPETDRRFIWPMFLKHRGGFFMGHIDCNEGDLDFVLDESRTRM